MTLQVHTQLGLGLATASFGLIQIQLQLIYPLQVMLDGLLDARDVITQAVEPGLHLTQRMASMTLDLPQPLGPTTEHKLEGKWMVVGGVMTQQKDLMSRCAWWLIPTYWYLLSNTNPNHILLSHATIRPYDACLKLNCLIAAQLRLPYTYDQQ